MARQRFCEQCGRSFGAKRFDNWFCSPACVAKYYRENPNPDYIHAKNYGEHWYTCEQCEAEFTVNDYARRGGKRAPKYCSNKCKQAAYRARGKGTQQQAARRERKTRAKQEPPHQEPPHQEPPHQEPPHQEPPHQEPRTAGKWRFVGTTRFDIRALGEAYVILGAKVGVTLAELKKLYMAKIRACHPDVNPSPSATEEAQAVNWAFDYLKKQAVFK